MAGLIFFFLYFYFGPFVISGVLLLFAALKRSRIALCWSLTGLLPRLLAMYIWRTNGCYVSAAGSGGPPLCYPTLKNFVIFYSIYTIVGMIWIIAWAIGRRRNRQ